MTDPVLRTRFALHMRHDKGSTYGDDIVDESGKTIGGRSQWVPKPKYRTKNPPRTVYTLYADRSEHETLDSFRAAYLKSIGGRDAKQA